MLASQFLQTSQTGAVLSLCPLPSPVPAAAGSTTNPPPHSRGSMTPHSSSINYRGPALLSIQVLNLLYLIHYHKPSSGNDGLSPEVLQHLATRVPRIYPPHCSQNNLCTSDHIPAGLRVEFTLLIQPAGLFGICHRPHFLDPWELSLSYISCISCGQPETKLHKWT